MINANWLFLIVPAVAILSFLLCALLTSASRADERIETIQEIEETAEEIIQACIDHVDCRHSRDYVDYDINDIGTKKIREILKGSHEKKNEQM